MGLCPAAAAAAGRLIRGPGRPRQRAVGVWGINRRRVGYGPNARRKIRASLLAFSLLWRGAARGGPAGRSRWQRRSACPMCRTRERGARCVWQWARHALVTAGAPLQAGRCSRQQPRRALARLTRRAWGPSHHPHTQTRVATAPPAAPPPAASQSRRRRRRPRRRHASAARSWARWSAETHPACHPG